MYGHPSFVNEHAAALKPTKDVIMNTTNNTATDTLAELFGEPIHTYTRKQAIEDGILVDLMQDEMAKVAREHFKFPIACTSAVFEIMRQAVENPRYANNYAGILHDMLWMSRRAGRHLDESTVVFSVIIQGAGRQKYHAFKLIVGPGDEMEPVITIMLPDEE
jgi:hypothetical protein